MDSTNTYQQSYLQTMNNILSTNFNVKSLIKFTFPTILMMVAMSSYTIIDGIFVAQFVGEVALSAINIVVPIFNILLSIGLMFASGGTAIVGKLMGQQRNKEAREFMSLLYLVTFIIGSLITIFLLIYSKDITRLLGADETLFKDAHIYLITVSIFSITLMFQNLANSLLVAAGKPKLGFILCLIGGIVNIILDYIFISPHIFNLGIAGAGLATGIGNSVPAFFCFIYFIFNKSNVLYITKPSSDIKLIFKACYNGMSELVGQLSIAITTFLFNNILYYFSGNDGIAAITVILYIQMLQQAVFIGYNIGVAPIISYKYGAKDHIQLHRIIKISMIFLLSISIIVIGCTYIFADLATIIFLDPSSNAFDLASMGLKITSLSFIAMSINLFISNLFTCLSNGHISALLAITRSLFCMVLCLLILPMIFKVMGVWIAVPIAEILAMILSIILFYKFKRVYNY